MAVHDIDQHFEGITGSKLPFEGLIEHMVNDRDKSGDLLRTEIIFEAKSDIFKMEIDPDALLLLVIALHAKISRHYLLDHLLYLVKVLLVVD